MSKNRMSEAEWLAKGAREGGASRAAHVAGQMLWNAYVHADLKARRTLIEDVARLAIDYAERVQGWDSSADQMRVDLIDDAEA